MALERRLDLARLDAEAAQLHLRVRPPQEVQHAIGPPARQVPGAVHPAPRRTERVGHEPLRRQPRTPQIAPRQTRTRNVQLTAHARRNGTQTAVQHVSAVIRQRTTDRDRRRIFIGSYNRETSCKSRAFSRTINMQQIARLSSFQHRVDLLHVYGFAAKKQIIQRTKDRRIFMGQLIEERGCQK